MKGVLDGTAKRLKALADALGLLGGFVLFALLMVTVAAVIMRYVFSAPILGAQDISEMGLVLVAFLGLVRCGARGGHVAVDLIGYIAPASLLRWTDGAVHLISAGLFGLLCYHSALRAFESREWGEATNLIGIPQYPFILVIAFCSGIYALILLLQSVRSLAGYHSKDNP